MSRIELTTLIAAPCERCFDLSLSIDVHLESTVHTGERVVAGPTSGVLALGGEITWEARHLGRRRRLSMTVSAYERPRMFRDELVRGPLRKLVHDHFFEAVGEGTEMRDVFELSLRCGSLTRSCSHGTSGCCCCGATRRSSGLRSQTIGAVCSARTNALPLT